MIALRGTHLKKKIKEDKDCVNKIARRLGYFLNFMIKRLFINLF